MNSVFSRFIRNFTKLNFANARNIRKFSASVRSMKHGSRNPHNLCILYGFTAAFSLTKLYEMIGLDENKEVKKMIQKAKQHLEVLDVFPIKDGDINEACVEFNKALKTALDTRDEEHEYIIKEQLALVSSLLKKYDEAEKLFVDVRNYFVAKNMQLDNLKMAYVNLKLAELYGCMKNDLYVTFQLPQVSLLAKILAFKSDSRKAQEYYKYCSKGLKKKITTALQHRDDEVIALWIMSLTSRAHFSVNRGNFEKAYKYFKKAYDACVLIHGELSEYAVTLLQQMGVVCYQKGNLELAVEYLKKATELGKHLPGMERLSNSHITLGNIYIQQGFFKDASALCTEGYKNAMRHKYEQGVKEANACLDELKRNTSEV